jgi:hypothetical protein
MNRLFDLSQIAVVLPYFGSEYESLTFMLYFNKKTNRLVKDYPAILGK